MTATNKLGLEMLQNAAANQTLANATFARLNQLVQAGVVDKDLAAPPASPADESLYIVGASATGAWAGRDGQLAYWLITAGAWQFIAPKEGFFLHVNDEDVFYKFTGTAWEVFSGGGGGGGMTNPMTSIRDLIVGGVGGAPTRLPGPTSEGLVLTRIGNALAWAIATGFANPMTAAGDIIFGGANGAATRLGAGTAGQVLTMVAGAPAWVAPSGGGGGVDTTALDLEAKRLMKGGIKYNSLPDVTVTGGSADIYNISSETCQFNSGVTTLSTLTGGTPGTKREVLFNGAVTIVHDDMKINCITGATIVTAALDVAKFMCIALDRWYMIGYERHSGQALAASAGFTEAQVRNTPLTSLPATTGDVTETDTVLSGIGKLQASKVDKATAVTSVAGRTGAVTLTKSDVGLANTDNTADSAKPVSVAQQAALDLKAPINTPSFTGGATVNGTASVVDGDLSIRRTSGAVQFVLNAAAGNYRYFRYLTNNSVRWDFGISNGAESGSDAGSDFYINAFSDTAAFLSSPWGITRATGETRMTRAAISGPVRVGQYTLTTLPAASAFSGYEIDVTNATVAQAGPKRCRSNGVNWLILNTNTPVS